MEKFSEAKLVECLNERGAAFNTKFKTFKEEFLKGNQYRSVWFRDWIHNAMRVFKKLLLGDELQPMSKIYIVKVRSSMLLRCSKIVLKLGFTQ